MEAAILFGALLDGSFEQIADAAADGRRFDRPTVQTVSDVWDNNTHALFEVACARTRRGRERTARVALEWMAALSPERRAWMEERAAAAGHRLDLPAPEPTGHGRDYLGRVLPETVPFTETAVLSVNRDYDLSAAEVRTLQIERAGTRLGGFLCATAGRRYPGAREKPPAEIMIWLEDVTEVRFDAFDTSRVALTMAPDGVTVAIGERGTVRADAGSLYFEDASWHLSAAGRAADARTPPRTDARPADPRERARPLTGAGLVAAWIMRGAMWEIRSVRYAKQVGRVPIDAFCRTFAGTGAAVTALGNLPFRHRDEAFRRLVRIWIDKADSALIPWFARELRRAADRTRPRPLPDGTREWVARLLATLEEPPPPKPATKRGPPARAELRLAVYSAANPGHEAAALVNLAVPRSREDAPWAMRALRISDLDRFHLDGTAFRGPTPLQVAGDPPTADSVSLDGGAFHAAGGSRSPA